MKHATPAFPPHVTLISNTSPTLVSTALPAKSQSEVLELLPIDGPEFKLWFAPAFSRWLRANFRNPEEIAVLFNVRNSTAWNWWNGDNKAQGDIVARAFLTFPDAISWFLQEWAAR